MSKANKKWRDGYSLIGTAMLLVVVGMGISAGLVLYGANSEQAKIDFDKKQQIALSKALEEFKGRNNRYPCPAPMNAPLDSPAFGREVSTNCSAATPVAGGTWRTAAARSGLGLGNVHIGALPVRALGIDDNNAFDANKNRIVYAVTEEYASPSAPFDRDRGGIALTDTAGASLTNVLGSAIYALIQPGSDKRGAFNTAGIQTSACDAGSAAAQNCDFADAIFVATQESSFGADTSLLTSSAAYEASRSEYFWNVGSWTGSGTCPNSPCGLGASTLTLNRTVTCNSTDGDVINLATDPTRARELCSNENFPLTMNISCPGTPACPPPVDDEPNGGTDDDGDGQSDMGDG